jgi:hypothetical protein
MTITINTKRYKLTINKLKEVLILNQKEITLKYEGYGSFIMKGLDKKHIRELDEVL